MKKKVKKPSNEEINIIVWECFTNARCKFWDPQFKVLENLQEMMFVNVQE